MESKPWLASGLNRVQVMNMIGERLYPKIKLIDEKQAGKITGMLIEGVSLKELDQCLEQELLLLAYVRKAQDALATHAATNNNQN